MTLPTEALPAIRLDQIGAMKRPSWLLDVFKRQLPELYQLAVRSKL